MKKDVFMVFSLFLQHNRGIMAEAIPLQTLLDQVHLLGTVPSGEAGASFNEVT